MSFLMNPRHRRSPRNLTLNDVFPDSLIGDGVFSQLSDMPWSDDVASASLDIAYDSRSNGKFVAPIVYRYLDEDGELTSAGKLAIANAMKALYLQKWTHLYDLYTVTYNPLNSYNITESGTRSGSETGSNSNTRTPNITERKRGDDDVTRSDSGTNSLTHGHIVTDSGSDVTTSEYGHVITSEGEPSSTTEQGVMAFNQAVNYSPTKKETSSSVTDDTETHSGEDTATVEHGLVQTNSGTDATTISTSGTEQRDIDISTTTSGTETNSGTNSNTSSETFSSTKSGTLYRAPAELMEEDRQFWYEEYFNIVFDDVDKFLTLGIYSERDANIKIF